MVHPDDSISVYSSEVDFLQDGPFPTVPGSTLRERRASFAGTTIHDYPTALPPSAFVLSAELRRVSRFTPYRPPPGSGPDVRWYCVVKPPTSPRQSRAPLATRSGRSATPTGSPHLSHFEHSPRLKKDDSRAFYAQGNEGPPRHATCVTRRRSHTVSGNGLPDAALPSKSIQHEWVIPVMGPSVTSCATSQAGTEMDSSNGGPGSVDIEPSTEIDLSELLADSVLSSPVATEASHGME